MTLRQLTTTCALSMLAVCAPRAQTINIWQGTNEHDVVKLTPYIAQGRDNIGVIVCPGGSYFWLDRDNEGHNVARWLRDQGISAFVLEYRTAGIPAFVTHYRLLFRGHRHPQMLQDVQRAIQLVRTNAARYNVSPQKIGVMGFSAGGHLALSAGAYSTTNFLAPLSIEPTVSLRPDFVAPIYPVVTFARDYMHRRSRRGLLGDNAKTKAMSDSMSIEKHISANMPPVFLVNCKDDPVVRYENSVLLDSALTARGVPHVYLQYATGGHGFGMSTDKGSPESREWKHEFMKWIRMVCKDE